jgi:hypothetical protein
MVRPVRRPAWRSDPAEVRAAPDRRSWTDEDLRRAVAASRSIRGVLVELGLQVGGGRYVVIRRHSARLGLSTAHFTGQGWNRGMRGFATSVGRPLESILVRDSDYTNTAALKRRLIAAGLLEARCDRANVMDGRESPCRCSSTTSTAIGETIASRSCGYSVRTAMPSPTRGVAGTEGATTPSPSPERPAGGIGRRAALKKLFLRE